MRQRKRLFASAIVITVVMLAALGGVVFAAQDKYTTTLREPERITCQTD
jgi:hypothetical protein